MKPPGILSMFAAMLWWLILVAWCAALVAPAATAMSAFTGLPAMEVTTDRVEAFFGDDHEAAGRFVAGYVVHPVFQASARVQTGCAILALVLLVLRRGAPVGRPRSISRRVGTTAAMLAIVTFAWYLIGVLPSVETALETWRGAVNSGDREAAAAAYAAFDPWHRSAERAVQLTFAAVLVAVIAGGIASAPARSDRR